MATDCPDVYKRQALNRKVLADLAVRQKEDFAKLVELAKTKLA